MEHMGAMRARSGTEKSADPLVSFLYNLMRDHLPAGAVEGIMLDTYPDRVSVFTNGWLARYAKDVATRLRELPSVGETMRTKVVVMCDEGDLEMLEALREFSSRRTLSQVMSDALQFYYTNSEYANNSKDVRTSLIKKQG